MAVHESVKMIKAEAHVAPETRLRSLLCIDDNPGNLKLVGLFMLHRPDIRLLTAVNGKSGLEIAWVSRPDVIVTDINLPDVSGFKVLESLRADPATTRIPSLPSAPIHCRLTSRVAWKRDFSAISPSQSSSRSSW